MSSPTDRQPESAGPRLEDLALAGVVHGVLVTDARRDDNPIVFVNPAFERLTGYSAAEATGRNCRFLQGPDSDPEAVAVLRAAVDAGTPAEATLVNYRRDGTSFWNRVRITPVRDPAGALTHFVGTQEDVSEQRQIERGLRLSEERVRLLLDSTAEAIYGLDERGDCTFCNPACARMLGFDGPAQLIGENMHRLVHHTRADGTPYPEQECQIYRAYREAKGTHVDDEVLWRRDGTSFPVEYWSYPIFQDGQLLGSVVTFIDITERVQARVVLEERNRAAEEANRRKDEFLALLSHELRNPLAPIRNATAMLRLRGDDPRTVARARDILERQTAHVNKLVDDLLDASRIDRGKIRLELERVDLAELLRRTVEDLRPGVEAAGVTLELELEHRPLWVEADATRLVQVFGNILDNARKFTPRGGGVRVRATMLGDQASVSVDDTGRGMDRGTLDHVFESFSQAQQSLDRRQGGLGLGMFVARELVHRHGGVITAASDGPEKGSTFTVSLPLVEPLVADDEPAPAPRPEGGPLRVLVIEDHRDSADSLRELLEFEGHRARAVYDGVTGLAEARRFVPDVILCDVGLPGLDGYQVATTIRKDRRLSAVRMVAITGYGREDDRRRAREAGFDHHLVKPVHIGDLRRLLEGGG